MQLSDRWGAEAEPDPWAAIEARRAAELGPDVSHAKIPAPLWVAGAGVALLFLYYLTKRSA